MRLFVWSRAEAEGDEFNGLLFRLVNKSTIECPLSPSLVKFMINIDYCGSMISQNIPMPTRQGVRKVLAEMMPEEALQYIDAIMVHIVRRIAENMDTFSHWGIIPIRSVNGHGFRY